MAKSRAEARRELVQAANRHIMRSHSRRTLWMPSRLLNQRQVQRAVFVCRQNRLVSAELLDAAGFRPERRRK